MAKKIMITSRQKSARRKNIAVARASKKRTHKPLSTKEKKSLLAYDMKKRKRRNAEKRATPEYYSKRKRAHKKSDMIKMARSGNKSAVKILAAKGIRIKTAYSSTLKKNVTIPSS